MSPKKKNYDTETAPVEAEAPTAETVTEAIAAPEKPAEQPTVTVEKLTKPRVAHKKHGITLKAYCRVKGIRPWQIAGMAAYTKTQRATLEEWERIFANY